ncbi:PIN domain-like protein [Mycena galopus ATCC 62051]|nr:PIN domain-like protein [Mycena galopus ATCC 62051]
MTSFREPEVLKTIQILKPASETKSILNLTTIHGFQADNRRLRTFILGDDVSIRINSVVAALQATNVFPNSPTGQVLVLEKIFYQLCNLSQAPVTVVFIDDGPGRPSVKRGTRVVFRPLWLIEHLKTMITSFGYYFYEAPGEAEAELAQLNARGKIDGILTEDSDAFLFGAQTVIRTLGLGFQHDSIIYSLEAIENTVEVSLDKAGLLLCALLLGGDYDIGVSGIGPVVAQALAAAGFGQDLVNILESFAGHALDERLAAWRDAIREELRTNSCGRLKKCQPTLARKIPETFPNLGVVDLYLKPLTSASVGYVGPMPSILSWTPSEPNVFDLSCLCSSLFGWHGEHLLNKFNSNLWPAVAFRMMSSVSTDAL